VADENLASSRSVDLHGRIAGPARSGVFVAEKQRAAAEVDDFSRSFVIGRVEPERLAWNARRDKGLNDTKRSPRFFAPRLQDDRDFQRDTRHPERIDARRI